MGDRLDGRPGFYPVSMTRRRWIGALLCSAALLGLLTSCTQPPEAPPGPEASAPAPATPTPEPEAPAPSEPDFSAPAVFSTGFAAPWSIAFHGQTPLVSERDSGRILELDGRGSGREAARIAGVSPGGEGGLLGIAVRGEHLYAYFTAAAENRIERFAILGEPGALSLGDAEEVLGGIPAAGNHNGGRIAFGPDGMLYATVGDAGDPGSAQRLDSLAGKILRMTETGGVPDDNPFPGSYVYSYGHRNPQGIGWGSDGSMYASEFGQNTWDELNVIVAGGNYGWPVIEGIAGDGDYVDPVQQWAPSEASPSGIAVTGEAIYIANLRGERLREVPLGELGSAQERLVGEFGRLRDVVVAPDGSLWLLSSNTDGRGSPGTEDDRIIRIGLI